MSRARAEIVVDLPSLRHNVARLREHAGVPLMAVVKADGYGHGIAEAGCAAREGGAEWLGVATIDEALALRAAGDTGRILSWLGVPGEDYAAAVEADVDVTAYSAAELAEVAAAARATSRPVRLQLKVDTGLSRGGATLADWPAVVAEARAGEQRGDWRVTGVWSHFACSDEPDHPANEAQQAAFASALRVAEGAGLRPGLRHLANSAAALLRPGSRFDLVRCGIATYGLDPAPGAPHELTSNGGDGLRPVMTASARLALVKRVAAGEGVSYGHTWTADRPTTLGLVPVGYGDGVLRNAGNRAEVLVRGKRRPVRGRVCMDQLVVDLGDDHAEAGDEVVLFGTGSRGEPTAQDWAEWCGTISYEIVSRIGGRFERRHVDEGTDR